MSGKTLSAVLVGGTYPTPGECKAGHIQIQLSRLLEYKLAELGRLCSKSGSPVLEAASCDSLFTGSQNSSALHRLYV